MILQRQLARRYKGKKYLKWTVTVPPRGIEQLGWGHGEVLKATVVGGRGGKLIIEAVSGKLRPRRGYVDIIQ